MVLGNSCELRPRQAQSHVVDAKSVYDVVLKESQGSKQDRRTAIELAIVTQAMKRARAQMRWLPHSKMVVDAMTKADPSKSNDALANFLKHGSLQLVDEASELERRKVSPSMKSRTHAYSVRRLADELSDEVSNLQSKMPVFSTRDPCKVGESMLPSTVSPGRFTLSGMLQ